MTKEYALKQLKGLPLDMRDAAKKDIDLRAYKTVEIVPSFEIWGNCFQMSVYYKFKLPDGKELYGRASGSLLVISLSVAINCSCRCRGFACKTDYASWGRRLAV